MNSFSYDDSPCLSNASFIESIELPQLLTSVGTYAFYRFTKNTQVTIPKNVVSIGYDAFA